MRILLIEDDLPLLKVVKRGLEAAGYEVEAETDGNAGLAGALSGAYGLVVLDLMLPGKNGREICAEMRARGWSTPVLMLTARDGVDDRLLGFEAGADDYLAKPFHFAELVARIKSLARRDAARLPAMPECLA